MDDAAPPQPFYDAFISYRRSDGGAVAQWLRRELQAYRLPKAMRGPDQPSLRLYLDTAYERGSTDFYAQTIRPALLASSHLIVIATPDAVVRADAAADWIQREVGDFASGPNAANVLIVRGAGELLAALPGDLDRRFPHAQVVDLRGAGRFAALNPFLASRLADEKLKLVAPLLGLHPGDMPALRSEEERRQQRRWGASAGAALAVVAIVAGATAFAFQSLWRARETLDDSRFYAERIIGLIARNLPADGKPDGPRSAMLNEACDLTAKLEAGSSQPVALSELVVCQVDRAAAHESLGEIDAAKTLLQDLTRVAVDRDAVRPSVASALARVEARQALVDTLARHRDAQAGAERERFVADTASLARRHAAEPAFAAGIAALGVARAEAIARAGNEAIDRDDAALAIERWNEALALRNTLRFDPTLDAEPRARNLAVSAQLSMAIAAFEYAAGHRAQSAKAKAQARAMLDQLRREPAASAEVAAEIDRLDKNWQDLR